MISTFGLSECRFYVSFLLDVDDGGFDHQCRYFIDFYQLFFNRTVIKSLVYKRLLDNTNSWYNNLLGLIANKITPLKNEDNQKLDVANSPVYT
jgi:hypothetical protein